MRFSYVMNTKRGFSLIEMLVVISIFAVIGILATTSVALTLRSSKKSDSLVRVRENVNYSLSIIERQIRNSESIDCTLVTAQNLPYVAEGGAAGRFNCTIGATGNIASASGALLVPITSSDISITACSFTCSQVNVNNPPVVRLSVSAEDATSTGTEKGTVSTDMEIVTRNY